jgi:PAS domain S-box-containing protein
MEIWVNCRAKYFSDSSGKNSKMSGVIQDISERKKVEEELNILSLVAKKTSNAVIITNLNKEIQWVNESVLEITEYSREEIIGKTPRMFQFEKTDKNEIQKINAAIKNRQPVWAEVLNKSKSGKEYWLSINIVPLNDDRGNLKGFMAVESNISERKKLEAQREEYVQLLEHSKKEIEQINEALEEKVKEKTKNIEHLALFPEQNPNPVLEFNFDARVLSYANPAARLILNDFIHQSFNGQLAALNIENWDKVHEANKSEFFIGDLIFEVNLFLLEDKNILRAYLHNITERKKQEAQLALLVNQLTSTEQELLSKKDELEKSLQELTLAQSEIISKERLSTLGMLIAGIAHEINTPLGAIKASGENLKYLFTEGVMRYIGSMNPEELNLSIKLYEKATLHSLSTAEERIRTQSLMAEMESLDFPLRFKQKMARMLVQKGIFNLDDELKSWMMHNNAEQIFQLGLNFVLILRSIITTTASSDQGGKVVKALNSFAHGNVGAEFTQFNLKDSIDTVITILWNKIKRSWATQKVTSLMTDVVLECIALIFLYLFCRCCNSIGSSQDGTVRGMFYFSYFLG